MNRFFLSLSCSLVMIVLPPTVSVAQVVAQPQAVLEAGTEGYTHQFRWQGIQGRLYVMQFSSDLVNWLNAGPHS